MAEYAYMGNPVNVVLATGLNNFRYEHEDLIMRRIRAFKRDVLGRKDGSTFAICTLPMAPSLTDIKSKQSSQDWNLGAKAMKMYRLNEAIKAENRPPTRFANNLQSAIVSTVPRFHAWGLMSDRRQTQAPEQRGNWFYRVAGYRYSDW